MFFFCTILQPKKIEEIKDFLITARRKDAKCKLFVCMYACVCVGGERGERERGSGV